MKPSTCNLFYSNSNVVEVYTYVQETAADIEAHQPKYEAICAKCEELIARGVQDTEDLQGKLDNVQQRWSTIQVHMHEYNIVDSRYYEVIELYWLG